MTNWEYLNIDFLVHFNLESTERKTLFGRVIKSYRIPEKIGWSIIVSKGNDTETLLTGEVEGEFPVYQLSTNEYGIRTILREYTITCDFKQTCFRYIQQLGSDGWEVAGNLPSNFASASDTGGAVQGTLIDVRGSADRENDLSMFSNFRPGIRLDASRHRNMINIWGSSFIFKRQRNDH